MKYNIFIKFSTGNECNIVLIQKYLLHNLIYSFQLI